MLDAELLAAFCTGFYGYGSTHAPHWFISMEEGGGKTEAEIAARIDAWHTRGRKHLEDVTGYHGAIGQAVWFSAHPPIQKTWAAMIRIVLAFEGCPTDVEAVRSYQRDRLGRSGGATRLSPLLPLPAQSISDWRYGEWSQVDALASRARYKETYSALRVAKLAEEVRALKPKTVTFFGTSYLSDWTQISTVPLVPVGSVWAAMDAQTTFIACRHPTARAISNAEFERIGQAHRAAHDAMAAAGN